MLSNMLIKPTRQDIEQTIDHYGLKRKWDKAKQLFESNIRHPSLNSIFVVPKGLGT